LPETSSIRYPGISVKVPVVVTEPPVTVRVASSATVLSTIFTDEDFAVTFACVNDAFKQRIVPVVAAKSACVVRTPSRRHVEFV